MGLLDSTIRNTINSFGIYRMNNYHIISSCAKCATSFLAHRILLSDPIASWGHRFSNQKVFVLLALRPFGEEEWWFGWGADLELQ